MSDVLQRITQSMSVVIGGIDTPGVAGPGMGGGLDSVCYWISLPISQCHLHSESGLTFFELSSLHFLVCVGKLQEDDTKFTVSNRVEENLLNNPLY